MRFARLVASAALFGALFATPALAEPPAHIISVSGQGTANGVPDQAQLSAGVATVAKTADAALAENARKMNAVFAALARLGVPDKAIQTSNFSVSPQYENNPRNDGEPARIVGYQVSNQVDVLLTDTKKLGPAIDALVGAGANQINSVSFTIRDAEALLDKARKAAVADARKRAATYAGAAGVSLGGVISIQENGGFEPPRPMMAMAGFRDKDSTPTAAGEQSVTANVSLVFELK
ncbi:MAG TPA: SIMPL domain-containing protein [Rhizomicrobium sp.]